MACKVCTSKPQRLEEGSSRGNTALFITDGSRKGTPNRLKTANREEYSAFLHKNGVFCGQSADFGQFIHKMGVFCGQSEVLSRFIHKKGVFCG